MLWHTCDLFLSPMKKNSMPNGKLYIYCVFEDSVSYSVAVEKNR